MANEKVNFLWKMSHCSLMFVIFNISLIFCDSDILKKSTSENNDLKSNFHQWNSVEIQSASTPEWVRSEVVSRGPGGDISEVQSITSNWDRSLDPIVTTPENYRQKIKVDYPHFDAVLKSLNRAIKEREERTMPDFTFSQYQIPELKHDFHFPKYELPDYKMPEFKHDFNVPKYEISPFNHDDFTIHVPDNRGYHRHEFSLTAVLLAIGFRIVLFIVLVPFMICCTWCFCPSRLQKFKGFKTFQNVSEPDPVERQQQTV